MLTVNANIDTSGLQDNATVNIEVKQWIVKTVDFIEILMYQTYEL